MYRVVACRLRIITCVLFVFSSRRRHTRCALVTGVQTCAHPIWRKLPMARIAGVNLPTNKRVIIALTYIHGIGRKTAVDIADKLGIDHSRRVQDPSDAEVLQIRETLDADHTVRSEEHTSELQSLIRLSYAVFCLTKKNQ